MDNTKDQFILNNDNNTIKTIYHMADIHIQSTSVDEYKQVFDNLFNELNKDKNKHESLIVICGDILHEKCRYDTSTIKLFYYFMDNLANLMPVIAIGGNHDGSIFNNNKEDGLDCIINHVTSKHEIHYLSQSGVYIYNNLAFGISSLYDGGFTPASKIPKNNKIKIALFHGSVAGCVLDNNFIISKYDKKVDDFKGYHYVLLGDTHSYQYLDTNKTICYPSSLIQQNHGEDLYNHGYVKWDLVKKTSQFCRVRNEYGYVTFNITNGKIEKFQRIYPIKSKLV